MRAISFHRSALSRQTAEAIRIRRRGGMGAVLNSKSEYNRCYIPRLRVVEEDETTEMEKQEAEQAKEMEEGLRRELVAWEAGKRNIRKSSIIQKSVSVKNRRQEYPDKEGRAPKRRKFPLIKNWGEEEQACRRKELGDSNGSSVIWRKVHIQNLKIQL